MPDNPRSPEQYLVVIQRRMSPREADEILREMGPPEEIRDLTRRVKTWRRAEDQRSMAWQFAKRVGIALATLLGVAVTLRSLLPAGWWPW